MVVPEIIHTVVNVCRHPLCFDSFIASLQVSFLIPNNLCSSRLQLEKAGSDCHIEEKLSKRKISFSRKPSFMYHWPKMEKDGSEIVSDDLAQLLCGADTEA